MSYRNITVDGTTYKYVVGKTHVKVHGLGVWKKEEVGQPKTIHLTCECCGEWLSDLYSKHVDPVHLQVAPSDVERLIRANLQPA